MAKAKVLADTISITSDVLTDENLRKVNILAPSVLSLTDMDEDGNSSLLYQVMESECNSFTKFGAGFKNGKSIGRIEECPDETPEEREANVKLILSAILARVNAIEEQVEAYLADAPEFDEDIEFLD